MATKSEVLKLLNAIPVRTGIERTQKKTNISAEKKFSNAFVKYADEKFNGNFKAAAESLGESREKIRGIFQRISEFETGSRAGNIAKGITMQTTTRTPKDARLLKDVTTDLKYNKNLLKKFVTDTNKNKFYTPKDIGNILKIDVSNKNNLDNLVADLKRLNVSTTEKSKQQKLYKFGDAVNKLTKGYFKTKLVKGDRKAATERLQITSKLDKELNNFISNTNNSFRRISKDLNIFQPNAMEDVGHPMSVKITDKYPKLLKNSNINKISTLVFQDPEINRKVLEATGYESKHDKLFKELNKFVDKKITPESQTKIIDIKNEMNKLYDKAIFDIKKISGSGTTLYNPRTKKYTTIQGSYFRGQENRLPKIDINVPSVGDTFKSENLFADMSVVDDDYRVGQVHKINPNAKVLNDLSDAEKNLFKENFVNQSRNNLEKFYTKAGFPSEDIKELSEAVDIGTDSRSAMIAVEAYDKASPAGKIKMENRIGCKRGCFIKTINEEPEKLIRLYRGEEPARKTELYKATKGTPGMYDESLKGRFFFDNPADARYYAQRQGTLTGNVKSIDVPEKMVNIGKKMADRRRGPNYSSEVILPKKFVGQEKINIPQTAFARAQAVTEGVTDKLKWDNIVGAFTTKDGDIATQADIKTYAAENPMKIQVGEEPIKAATNKSVLANVGKSLARIGAPLPTALLDSYFIGQQVKEGKGTAEIASDPLNWLGLATMEPLTKISGVAKGSGALNKALRLGLNPATIRGISRFAGLPGLAISTAMTAYDQYQKYKDGEGFIFNLLNQKGTE